MEPEYNGTGSSKARAGSSITDELRECIKTANRSYEDARNPYNDREVLHIVDEELLAIADRIDERHEDIIYDYRREYEDFKSYRDIAYIKLPVDADGKAIHVGDEVELLDGSERFKVEWIEWDGDGWAVHPTEGYGPWYEPGRLRHVEPDTWERIIEDALLESHWDEPSPDDDDYERGKRVRDMVISELVERCRRLADGD